MFCVLKMLICSQFLWSPSGDHEDIFNQGQLVAADRLKPAVATDSSQDLQQMDCDPNQASNGGCMRAAEPSRKQEIGILRIVPSDADVRKSYSTSDIMAVLVTWCLRFLLLQADADYWLASGVDVSMTDAWGT